jgi:hypothetical protein
MEILFGNMIRDSQSIEELKEIRKRVEILFGNMIRDSPI